MKSKCFAIVLIAALWPALAQAQTNLPILSGVITADVGQSSKFKVTVSATISSVLLTSSTTPAPYGGQQISIIFTENATGGFSVTFGGNIGSGCSVTTTANATTTCIFTYDASANAWSVSGGNSSGSGASTVAPIMGWYLGPACASTQGQCFNSPANTQEDNTATWTTTGPTITITDGAFTPADVGKMAWGYGASGVSVSGCNPYIAQPAAAYVTLTHLTIASFVDSNHVTLNGNPANTWSTANTGCFIWGSPDDTGAAALDTALQASTSCPRVNLLGGYYLFTTPPAILWRQYNSCANLGMSFPNGATLGNVFFAGGYEVEGRGVGPTTLFFPPDFPQTGSCNHGVNSNACLAVPPEGIFHDFSVTAGTARSGIPANSAFINVDVGSLEHFTCWNIGGNSTSHFGGGGTAGVLVSHWAQLQQINVSACGSDGVVVDISTAMTLGNGPFFLSRGYRVHSENAQASDFYIQAGANWTCVSCVAEGQVQGSGVTGWFAGGSGSVLRLIEGGSTNMNFSNTNHTAYGCFTNSNCILYAEYADFGTSSTSTNTNGIFCTVACTNYLGPNVRLSGSGTGFAYKDVAGSALYDLGGNKLNLGTGVSISGSVFGAPSITGTAALATNITPSTGWGTTGAAGNGVTAVSGNTRLIQFTITATGTPAANPTITVTFPSPFLVAPICSIRQVGGTGAQPTQPFVVPSPSITGTGAITWTGTPVAASTYIFQLSCDLP